MAQEKVFENVKQGKPITITGNTLDEVVLKFGDYYGPITDATGIEIGAAIVLRNSKLGGFIIEPSSVTFGDYSSVTIPTISGAEGYIHTHPAYGVSGWSSASFSDEDVLNRINRGVPEYVWSASDNNVRVCNYPSSTCLPGIESYGDVIPRD